MKQMASRTFSRRPICLAALVGLLTLPALGTIEPLEAQGAQMTGETPNLVGVWDGGPRVRRINGPNAPWTPGENFPVLNERAEAFQEVFDEAIAPKYDCVPAASPALQYDPYFMEVVQWPDRVMFRYEKDDQLRIVWLDGREPPLNDFSVQGFSSSKNPKSLMKEPRITITIGKTVIIRTMDPTTPKIGHRKRPRSCSRAEYFPVRVA